MCGIAGFLGPWSGQLAEAMVAQLRHRGPDDEGCHFDAAAGLALGHTRLSIIDLTDAAHQPMSTADGRYTISFNGEIYNYRSLRDELLGAGITLRTRSDTEVLLALYARDGAACLERLHGIFAFAIWDSVEKRLFLARDHLGVKPLYYAVLDQGFVFASEVKALTLCTDLPREIDPVALADHLGFLWTPGEGTILKAVRKLRPGCTLTVDAAGVRQRRYYRTPLPETKSPGSPDALRDLIDQVVAEQMVADVDVGALLSGGLDSSAIVAAMCRAADPGKITTFCAAVTGSDSGGDNFGDDRRHAIEVAGALGVRLIEVPTETDLIDQLPAMMWQLDEPTADFAALQTLILAQAARDNGIKVLLSGVGGDDLFAGYSRHRAAMIHDLLSRVPGGRAATGALARLFPAGSLMGRRLRRTGELLAMDEETMLTEAMSFSAIAGEHRLALLSPWVREALGDATCPAPFAESFAATKALHPVERALDLELNGFMPDHNLNYTDKMAMQAGVEVRVPLCDPKLVDFAAHLPIADKIDPWRTKKILRASQEDRLPRSVLRRPKQGFGVPMRGWLRGAARPLMEELTSESVVASRGLFDAAAVTELRQAFLSSGADAALTLFPLMAIEVWCRALDAAPTVGCAATGPTYRMAVA
ncbi:MAG: asparagine synthase (glutamine-hydrolyzing) [Alphaproteobacteria bacterium]